MAWQCWTREIRVVTIPELLEQRAQEFEDRTFIICEDVEYSFRTLHENTCRVAANLAARGLGKDDRIVLLMGNRIEFLYRKNTVSFGQLLQTF